MARVTNKPKRKIAFASLRKQAVSLGALHAKAISTRKVFTGAWVRWKCRFGCDGYGSSLLCPPHSPTPKRPAGYWTNTGGRF